MRARALVLLALLLTLGACSARIASEHVEPLPVTESKATSTASAAPAPSASASVGGVTCEHECDKASSECDRRCPDGESGRGCLKKCGCAQISCKHGCTETGVAVFRCR